MSRREQPRRSRRRDERGAVLIEFVLVAPVLILFALGILEFGNAYSQIGSVERAAQQGARAVSSMGNGRYADYEALRAIDASTRGLSGVTVEKVVIFNATSITDGEVPDSCLTSSRSGLCNTYTGAQVRSPNPSGFGGDSGEDAYCASGAWDSAWCPVGRPRDHNNRTRIGVHLVLTYHPITQMFPGEITIERTAVYQIEPCSQGQVSC